MDKYNIGDLIGEGSFGRVHRATVKPTENVVAMKIISKANRNKKDLKTFQSECEIQRGLSHPNIIRMFEAFETPNEIVVITEYADTDLHKLLKKCRHLQEERVQQLTWQLMSALHYLHSQRILHRDLKPQNILLDAESKHVKLCDFGLARSMTNQTYLLTSIKGTPLYMAPEVVHSQPYDQTAEFWSMGCIIYEMLMGKPPFKCESIVHLCNSIKHAQIAWPESVSADCLLFLKGLLQKKAQDRFTWDGIKNHPFVKDRLTISAENVNSPLTNPLTASQIKEKEKQRGEILHRHDLKMKVALPPQQMKSNKVIKKKAKECLSDEYATASSMDSVNAFIHTDVENIETDIDEKGDGGPAPNARRPSSSKKNDHKANEKVKKQLKTGFNLPDNPNLVLTRFCENFEIPDAVKPDENPNLMIARFNENFEIAPAMLENRENESQNTCEGKAEPPSPKLLTQKGAILKNRDLKPIPFGVVPRHGNKDLEKRKLSQNLDNFSLRLGTNTSSNDTLESSGDVVNRSKENPVVKSDSKTKMEKLVPQMEAGWDSCDDHQSPPIENEEWLEFLQSSMKEVLDGEIDSLKQQNLVEIIVAILRNLNASSVVICGVAQLLSLPLVLFDLSDDLREIKNVYVQVKLVPNLIYASNLICTGKSIQNSTSTASSDALTASRSPNYRQMTALSVEELKTLSTLYELTCHLVHLNEQFLFQFCDSVDLIAKHLLIHFLSNVVEHPMATRLNISIIALLGCALRELPENARLVEEIIFHPNVNILTFLKSKYPKLRSRMCMTLRVIGRFSCVSLQSVWTPEFKQILETLSADEDRKVRILADEVIEEFKYLSFYGSNVAVT